MGQILPGTGRGGVFADARGPERTMRVTHHPEQDIVVLSLWLGPLCRSSFRLPVDQVDGLVAALTNEGAPESPTPGSGTEPGVPPTQPLGPPTASGAVDGPAVLAGAAGVAPDRATAASSAAAPTGGGVGPGGAGAVGADPAGRDHDPAGRELGAVGGDPLPVVQTGAVDPAAFALAGGEAGVAG
ncbi:hypothetical protein ACFFWC_12635 [Plantactinospora siamensis]|uniref:Uncharacterized protein n=1 Tax=Plantactinospora siamensis TaxID=555372 RepID=A0ABV6P1V8_9ACTN